MLRAAVCWQPILELWRSVPDDPCGGHVRDKYRRTDAIQVALLSFQPCILRLQRVAVCRTSLPLLLAATIPLKLEPIVSINSFCPLPLFGFLYAQWCADISPRDGVDSRWLGKRWHLHVFAEPPITFLRLNIYALCFKAACLIAVWSQNPPAGLESRGDK